MLEHHHPRLALACSFQKEEARADRHAACGSSRRRGSSRSTPACCSPRPTRRGARSSSRYGVRVEVFDALRARRRRLDARQLLLGAQGRGARAGARRPRRLDHRAAPRAGADPRAGAASSSFDERRGIWKANPLADWDDQGGLAATSPQTTCRTTRCTTAATSRSAACPVPFPGPGAKGAGPVATRPSAASTSEARMSSTTTAATSRLTHLRALESEAVHVLREVAAGFERPVLLFSVGARIRLCCCGWRRRRFVPARFPFPLMHVDTGENFPEAIEFRDRRVSELGERLIVASVQDSIDQGRVVEEVGPARVTQPAADHDAA